MEYVIVTGASTGIGYAITKYLIDRNYFVFGSVRKTADAERLAADFGEQSFRALLFDVTDREAIEKARLEVASSIGEQKLTALVNNAGIAVGGPLKYLSEDEIRQQMEVNVIGLLSVTQAFIPYLENPSSVGKIINISSVSGLLVSPFTSLYSASKFAVEALTHGLRRELKFHGITAVSIQPGPIKTPIWDKALSFAGKYDHTEYGKVLQDMDRFIKKTEQGAIPPEKVAQVVYRALTARNPRATYLVMKGGIFARIISWLPHSWVDKLMSSRAKRI
ncbi:MAG: SDR family oxidoreductase [Saprospiraceae bacterium]|nr:SDR family oxidoreductase [Saprospiraceae bacterium]